MRSLALSFILMRRVALVVLKNHPIFSDRVERKTEIIYEMYKTNKCAHALKTLTLYQYYCDCAHARCRASYRYTEHGRADQQPQLLALLINIPT